MIYDIIDYMNSELFNVKINSKNNTFIWCLCQFQQKVAVQKCQLWFEVI